MIRVAFIIESEESAAARYRVLSNVEAFEREGIDVYPMMIAKTHGGRLKLFEDVSGFDVVVLQRRLLRRGETRALRREARVLGYDFDDAMLLRDRGPHFRSISRSWKFRGIIKAADFVTAGNQYLAGMSGLPEEKRVVVPTPVDTTAYSPAEKSGDRVRIGWVGSKSTVGYLDRVTEAIERVAGAGEGVEFAVVSDAFPSRRPPFMKCIEWKAENEAAEVAAFDIGIMPLPDNPWTRGKCGFKLLLYGACGVASVASPVGVNPEIIRDGETGLLPSSAAEWERSLVKLVNDAALRNRMGQAARERVEKFYSTRVVVKRWASILKAAAHGTPLAEAQQT